MICCSLEIDRSSSSFERSRTGFSVSAGASCPGASDALGAGTIAVTGLSATDDCLSEIACVCSDAELDVVSGVVVVVGFELVVGDDDDDGVLLRGVQMIRPEFGSEFGCQEDGRLGGCRGVEELSGLPGFLRIDFSFGSLGFKILDLDLSPSLSSSDLVGTIGPSCIDSSSV